GPRPAPPGGRWRWRRRGPSSRGAPEASSTLLPSAPSSPSPSPLAVEDRTAVVPRSAPPLVAPAADRRAGVGHRRPGHYGRRGRRGDRRRHGDRAGGGFSRFPRAEKSRSHCHDRSFSEPDPVALGHVPQDEAGKHGEAEAHSETV